jgi:hypothetical protein
LVDVLTDGLHKAAAGQLPQLDLKQATAAAAGDQAEYLCVCSLMFCTGLRLDSSQSLT